MPTKRKVAPAKRKAPAKKKPNPPSLGGTMNAIQRRNQRLKNI